MRTDQDAVYIKLDQKVLRIFMWCSVGIIVCGLIFGPLTGLTPMLCLMVGAQAANAFALYVSATTPSNQDLQSKEQT